MPPPEWPLLGGVGQDDSAHGHVRALLHPHQHAVAQRLQLRDVCRQQGIRRGQS